MCNTKWSWSCSKWNCRSACCHNDMHPSLLVSYQNWKILWTLSFQILNTVVGCFNHKNSSLHSTVVSKAVVDGGHLKQSWYSPGKWKMLKCGNRRTETEVRKPKYESEKKNRSWVFSALLAHECVCWGLVTKRWLYPCDVRAGPWDLGVQRASLSTSQCDRPKLRWLTVSGPTMRALCSWVLLKVMQMRVLS